MRKILFLLTTSLLTARAAGTRSPAAQVLYAHTYIHTYTYKKIYNQANKQESMQNQYLSTDATGVLKGRRYMYGYLITRDISCTLINTRLWRTRDIPSTTTTTTSINSQQFAEKKTAYILYIVLLVHETNTVHTEP